VQSLSTAHSLNLMTAWLGDAYKSAIKPKPNQITVGLARHCYSTVYTELLHNDRRRRPWPKCIKSLSGVRILSLHCSLVPFRTVIRHTPKHAFYAHYSSSQFLATLSPTYRLHNRSPWPDDVKPAAIHRRFRGWSNGVWLQGIAH